MMKTKFFNIAFCMAIAFADAFGDNGLFNIEQVDLLEEPSVLIDSEDERLVADVISRERLKMKRKCRKQKAKLLSRVILNSQRNAGRGIGRRKSFGISKLYSNILRAEYGVIDKQMLEEEGKLYTILIAFLTEYKQKEARNNNSGLDN